MKDDLRPKLKREWAGRYVELVRDVRNGAGTLFRRGEVMRVHHIWRGVHLNRVFRCAVCGNDFRQEIIVAEADVKMLPPDYGPEPPARMIAMTPALEAALKFVIEDKEAWSPVKDVFKQALKEAGSDAGG